MGEGSKRNCGANGGGTFKNLVWVRPLDTNTNTYNCGQSAENALEDYLIEGGREGG
jgi:hypothetical protein